MFGNDVLKGGETSMNQQAIPGYTYGTSAVPRSPMSLEDFERLKQSVLFSDEDSQSLRLSYDVLQDQVEDILNVWYGFVASHPFLVHFFSDTGTGQPDGPYLAAVRKRFGQWILDTAKAHYDQAWLDYQYEIGLRHYRGGKNRTDGVNSVDNVSYRYLPALL
jgi:Protoglobin